MRTEGVQGQDGRECEDKREEGWQGRKCEQLADAESEGCCCPMLALPQLPTIRRRPLTSALPCSLCARSTLLLLILYTNSSGKAMGVLNAQAVQYIYPFSYNFAGRGEVTCRITPQVIRSMAELDSCCASYGKSQD